MITCFTHSWGKGGGVDGWLGWKFKRILILLSNMIVSLTWWRQYILRNMHTVFALLCFIVVIHWLIFPYPTGLLHWHRGNLTIAPVPAKQPWWIWINTSCEFIMNDCITTTKESTTKPCAYFLGYTVYYRKSNSMYHWDAHRLPQQMTSHSRNENQYGEIQSFSTRNYCESGEDRFCWNISTRFFAHIQWRAETLRSVFRFKLFRRYKLFKVWYGKRLL